MPTKSQIPLR